MPPLKCSSTKHGATQHGIDGRDNGCGRVGENNVDAVGGSGGRYKRKALFYFESCSALHIEKCL